MLKINTNFGPEKAVSLATAYVIALHPPRLQPCHFVMVPAVRQKQLELRRERRAVSQPGGHAEDGEETVGQETFQSFSVQV